MLFFVAVTALFLDFTGAIHAYLGWTAKVQFLPALLALNAGVVAGLVVLTLLFGRVYCSVVCPLGVMQDIISWASGRRKKKRLRFSYSPERKWLRYGMLALFVAALAGGCSTIVALLAPYSSYGRMAANLLAPLYRLGNNALAYVAERLDSYAFYSTEVWIKSLPTFIISCLFFILIFVLAWRGGRTWCNTVCPVGTVLGQLSRFALFAPVIDGARCKDCGLCARKCKAGCIDYGHHKVDYSRCVACMDCLDTCKHGAIGLKCRIKRNGRPSGQETPAPKDNGRRNFLSAAITVAAAATVEAQTKKVDGGLALIEDKKVPNRATPLLPAGSWSANSFQKHCTACQLCVSACPNGVLRPSAALDRLMQPEMQYERGYCRPECTRCSEVCPAGAIRPVSVAEKSSIRIGHAVWVKQNCVAVADGVECGNCARHCPSGAIIMVPQGAAEDGLPRIPVVNAERCIGCGACENLCPARPFSAIYVEGHTVHSVM